jgi:hypothetical protein
MCVEMSRSYRKFSGSKDVKSAKAGRTAANHRVRRLRNSGAHIDDHGGYKRCYEQWNIVDYRCFRSPAEQSSNFHNPIDCSYSHPCDPTSYIALYGSSGGYESYRWVDLPKELPRRYSESQGHWEYVLPEGGFIPEHMNRRFNPQTGFVEHQDRVFNGYDRRTGELRFAEGWKVYPLCQRYAVRVDRFLELCESYPKRREQETRNLRLRRRFTPELRRHRRAMNLNHEWARRDSFDGE